MPDYHCGQCGKTLEEIGIPPGVQLAQQYQNVVNVGSGSVPEEVRKDPFLYRGFFCTACKKAFCPTCCQMQGEICPQCKQKTLMPAYRPFLRTGEAVAGEKLPSPALTGPARGLCPHCGESVLSEQGQLRIRLFVKETEHGPEQAFGCPKCQKEWDPGQFTSKPANAQAPAAKGACFVATAAFGSAMQPEVELLRRFRDERLASHAAGMLFIRIYNVVGPRLAGQVRRSPLCRSIARAAIRAVCVVLRRGVS